jgi:hypothetical protein
MNKFRYSGYRLLPEATGLLLITATEAKTNTAYLFLTNPLAINVLTIIFHPVRYHFLPGKIALTCQ